MSHQMNFGKLGTELHYLSITTFSSEHVITILSLDFVGKEEATTTTLMRDIGKIGS